MCRSNMILVNEVGFTLKLCNENWYKRVIEIWHLIQKGKDKKAIQATVTF